MSDAMQSRLDDHNALVMRIGAALEGVDADAGTCAMLEVIAITIVDSVAGDPADVETLHKQAQKTLAEFIGLSLIIHGELQEKGEP